MLTLILEFGKQRSYKSLITQFYPLHLFLNHVRSFPYLLYLPGYPIRSWSTRGILIGIDVVIDIVACFDLTSCSGCQTIHPGKAMTYSQRVLDTRLTLLPVKAAQRFIHALFDQMRKRRRSRGFLELYRYQTSSV